MQLNIRKTYKQEKPRGRLFCILRAFPWVKPRRKAIFVLQSAVEYGIILQRSFCHPNHLERKLLQGKSYGYKHEKKLRKPFGGGAVLRFVRGSFKIAAFFFENVRINII